MRYHIFLQQLRRKGELMATFKQRVFQSLVLGLIVASFIIYSSSLYYTTPLQLHYIERQEYGHNSSQVSHQPSSNTAIPANSEKIVVLSTQSEDSATGFSVASLVAYPHISPPSLPPSPVSLVTISNSSVDSFNQTKSGSVGKRKTPLVLIRQEKEVKKTEKPHVPPVSQSGIPAHEDAAATASSDPMACGLITSSLYVSGHDIISPDLCPNFGSEMQLLILVTSAPQHAEGRMAIRQTWGHFGSRRDVSVGFFVATSLDNETQHSVEMEAALYNDIIRANFFDSYVNLTLKTISMLEWVDKHCPKVRFFLKTDDDMFINVPRLLNFIAKRYGEKRVIYGRLAKKWKPIRNKKSKYYVSSKQYKPATFPDFTTGPAYLLTSDTVHDLYVTALNKTYLHLEDVFVTGIVAQDIKIKRVHSSEFLNKRISFQACNIQKGISIHMVKYPEQFDLWKKLLDGRTKCK